MEKPNLKIKQVLVTAEIPVRGAACNGDTCDMNASFHVNTETWECDGEVAGHPVMADAEWWKEQCQRVSDRVRAGLTNLTV